MRKDLTLQQLQTLFVLKGIRLQSEVREWNINSTYWQNVLCYSTREYSGNYHLCIKSMTGLISYQDRLVCLPIDHPEIDAKKR